MRRQPASFPPRGFVGRGSMSSAVTDLHGYSLISTRLRRIHSTPDAHLWRLTCEWEISQLP